MKNYEVTLPIAGHALVYVEADNEEEAIEKAFNTVTIDHIEDWDALKRFNKGNVCYCPQPWEAEAVTDEEDE